MKIKVEAPFDKEWERAYLSTRKDGRAYILLFSATKETTISYARYLMSVKLGRKLLKEETVDHIDNDKTNDSLDNLQILTLEENRNKYIKTIPPTKHGTSTMYKKGCRCSLCKEWQHNYRKNYMENNPLQREKHNNTSNNYNKRKRKIKDLRKICKCCGKEFFVTKADKSTQFCSKECVIEFRFHKNINKEN